MTSFVKLKYFDFYAASSFFVLMCFVNSGAIIA